MDLFDQHIFNKLSSLVSFLCIAFLLTSRETQGAKILLLPVTAGSHILTFQQIGTALKERGHILHAVVNQDCKRIKQLTKTAILHGYKTPSGCLDDNKEVHAQHLRANLGGGSFMKMFEMLKEMGHYLKDETEGYLNENIYKDLKEENFDIAIVDAIIFARSLYILPHRLGIPVISVAAVTNLLDTGIPALPSFTPTIREGRFTNRMSFLERVQNTLISTMADRISSVLLGQSDLATKYSPEKPFQSLYQLQVGSAFWLIMNEISIDYPQVSLPHVVNIGGINTGPGKELTGKYKEIADGAKEGLVVISFGSTVSDFPPEITARLYNEFKLIKQPMVWRYTGKAPKDVPSNLHLVDWMPQNDLLAHPNTKVFVTHCGCNGQFEALYHGVAMVGLPIFGDQKYNAIRMANKGMGIHLDLVKFKPGELVAAINEALVNQIYTEKVQKHSKIFKSQPQKPMERAVYWIEHVIEYGYEHLRSTAVDMPWYQYWCLDALLFLALIFSAAAIVVFMISCFLFRKCRSCCCNKTSQAALGKKKAKRQ